MTPKQEARLYQRAVRQRWDVPDETKADVVARMHYLVNNAEKESDQIAAANCLRNIEQQNQRDEFAELDKLKEMIFAWDANRNIIRDSDGPVGKIGQ